MALILVVDDDVRLRGSFERLLGGDGHETLAAGSGEEGLEAVRLHNPDLVIMDVCMPGLNGLETLKKIKEIAPHLPVLIMTAFGTTDTAIEAMNKGAFDYILKPFDIPKMFSLISQALAVSLQARQRREPPETPVMASDGTRLVGKSQAMQDIYKMIGRVAATEATVLVRGESGTGKELVARAIYGYSPRKHKPFMTINCVAIPETLLESELFGFEKGAFTGASARRAGKIEQANGGTVFFDEVGDMPLSIQAKILRLLQEKSLERLGGRETIKVDVRIIAATNLDLEAAMAEGRFREDLYYRLKVVSLSLPPLRERKNDIALLSGHLLAKHCQDMKLKNPGLTPGALEALAEYDWPGNVRELSNVLQKTLIFNRGAPICTQEVVSALKARQSPNPPAIPEEIIRDWIREILASPAPEGAFTQLTENFASLVISQALKETGGNRSQAARLLGISRPTLLARIEKHSLNIENPGKKGQI